MPDKHKDLHHIYNKLPTELRLITVATIAKEEEEEFGFTVVLG